MLKEEVKEKLEQIKGKTDDKEIHEICDELKEEVRPKAVKTRGDPVVEMY